MTGLPGVSHRRCGVLCRTGRRYIGEATKSPELLLIKEQVSKPGGVPGDAETTAVWYCLNGSILACPDLHTLIANRLVSYTPYTPY